MPRVAASFGANTNSWIPQPKSGRITRSPFVVRRMIRIDCLMLSSYSARAKRFFVVSLSSIATGNCQPTPRNLAISPTPFAGTVIITCLITDQHSHLSLDNLVGRTNRLQNRIAHAARLQTVNKYGLGTVYHHTGTMRGDGQRRHTGMNIRATSHARDHAPYLCCSCCLCCLLCSLRRRGTQS